MGVGKMDRRSNGLAGKCFAANRDAPVPGAEASLFPGMEIPANYFQEEEAAEYGRIMADANRK